MITILIIMNTISPFITAFAEEYTDNSSYNTQAVIENQSSIESETQTINEEDLSSSNEESVTANIEQDNSAYQENEDNTNDVDTAPEQIPVITNYLEYDNANQQTVIDGKSPYMRVEITGEYDFPEGSFAWIQAIQEDELSQTISTLNSTLNEQDMYAEPVLSTRIEIDNYNGEEIENIKNVLIRIYTNEVYYLNETTLYHQKHNGEWETLNYTLYSDNVEEPYVEFYSQTLSPFIFAKTQNVENEIAIEETENISESETETEAIIIDELAYFNGTLEYENDEIYVTATFDENNKIENGSKLIVEKDESKTEECANKIAEYYQDTLDNITAVPYTIYIENPEGDYYNISGFTNITFEFKNGIQVNKEDETGIFQINTNNDFEEITENIANEKSVISNFEGLFESPSSIILGIKKNESKQENNLYTINIKSGNLNIIATRSDGQPFPEELNVSVSPINIEDVDTFVQNIKDNIPEDTMEVPQNTSEDEIELGNADTTKSNEYASLENPENQTEKEIEAQNTITIENAEDIPVIKTSDGNEVIPFSVDIYDKDGNLYSDSFINYQIQYDSSEFVNSNTEKDDTDTNKEQVLKSVLVSNPSGSEDILQQKTIDSENPVVEMTDMGDMENTFAVIMLSAGNGMIDYPYEIIFNDEGYESNRPDLIEVNIYNANDKDTILQTQTINISADSNTYTGVFEDLPQKNTDNTEAKYIIKELPVENYVQKYGYSDNKIKGFYIIFGEHTSTSQTITIYTSTSKPVINGTGNEFNHRTVYIPVEENAETGFIIKTAGTNRELNIDSIAAETNEDIHLENIETYNIDLDSTTVENLTITQTFKDDDYPVDNSIYYGGEVSKYILNSSFDDTENADIIYNNINKTDVPFEKEWDDEGYEEYRPETFTIELYSDHSNNTPIAEKTLPSGTDTTVSGVFENMPKYADDKREIQYYIKEKNTSAYYKPVYDVIGGVGRNKEYNALEVQFDAYNMSCKNMETFSSYDSQYSPYYKSINKYDENSGDFYAGSTVAFPAYGEDTNGIYIKINQMVSPNNVKITSIKPTKIVEGGFTNTEPEIFDYNDSPNIIYATDNQYINLKYNAFNSVYGGNLSYIYTWTGLSNPFEGGLKVKNIINKQNIKFTKEWKDEGFESERPDSIKFDIYNINNMNTPLRTTYLRNAKNIDDYEHVFKNLPIYNEDGTVAVYKVVEEIDDNKYIIQYQSANAVQLNYRFDSENEHHIYVKDESGNVSIYNINAESGEIIVPYGEVYVEKCPVKLSASPLSVPQSDIAAPASTLNNMEFTNVMTADENTINTLDEYLAASYENTDYFQIIPPNEIGTKITNTPYIVRKIWNDTGYEDRRPNEITIDIYKENNLETPVKTITLSANDIVDGDNNQWGRLVSDIDLYDNDGNLINYIIKERDVDDYYTRYDTDKVNGFKITFNSRCNMADGCVRLITSDNKRVNFYINGQYTDTLSGTSMAGKTFFVPFGENGERSFTLFYYVYTRTYYSYYGLKVDSIELCYDNTPQVFTDNIMYVNPEDTYELPESQHNIRSTSDIALRYLYNNKDSNIYSDIVKNNTTLGMYPLEKYWDDEGYEDERPNSITLKLVNHETQEDTGKSLVLTAEDADTENPDCWKGYIDGVKLYDENGDKIEYDVVEENLSDLYQAFEEPKDGLQIKFDDNMDYSTWYSILQFYMIKDGKYYYMEVNRNENNLSNKEFNIMFDNSGKYYFRETTQENFERTINNFTKSYSGPGTIIKLSGEEYPDTKGPWQTTQGFVWESQIGSVRLYTVLGNMSYGSSYPFKIKYINPITNDGNAVTNKINRTEISVQKSWDDESIEDNRPESVTIDLFDENDMTTPVRTTTVTDTYTFENLPKYHEDGTYIHYIAKEREVEGYHTTYHSDYMNGLKVTFTADSYGLYSSLRVGYKKNGKIYEKGNYTEFSNGNSKNLSVYFPADNFFIKINKQQYEVEDSRKSLKIASVTPVHMDDEVYASFNPVYESNISRYFSYSTVIYGDDNHLFSTETDITEEFMNGNSENLAYFYNYDFSKTFEGDASVVNHSDEKRIVITKTWDDEGYESKRPNTLTLIVYNANNPDTILETIEVDSEKTSNEQTITTKKLPKYNNDGTEAEYVVKETNSGDYVPYYSCLLDDKTGLEIKFTDNMNLSDYTWIFMGSSNKGYKFPWILNDGYLHKNQINGNTFFIPFASDEKSFWIQYGAVYKEYDNITVEEIAPVKKRVPDNMIYESNYEPTSYYNGRIYTNKEFEGIFNDINNDGNNTNGAHKYIYTNDFWFKNAFKNDTKIKNKYREVPLTINAKKIIENGALSGEEFAFELSENGRIVQTKQNDANGDIEFSILYTLEDVGLHTYTLSEKSGNLSKITYDTSTFTITVNVFENNEGQLETTLTYPNNTIPEFTNTHTPNLYVKKENNAHTMIGGATLQLLTLDEQTVVDEWVSSSEAAHKVSGTFTVGDKYILREKTPPTGYVKADDIEVTISDNITTNQTITMTNEYSKHNVEIKKLGYNNKEITGATLKVTGREQGATSDITPIQWVSGSDGMTNGEYNSHVLQLKPGTYKLSEMNVPAGYLKADDIDFMVSPESGDIIINEETVDSVTMVDTPVSVPIRKIGANGDLANVVLTLSGTSSNQAIDLSSIAIKSGTSEITKTMSSNNTICEFTTSGSTMTLYKIPAGHYTLHEKTTVAGYCIADDIVFDVSNTGVITINNQTVSSVVMENEQTELKIKKTTRTGTILPNAVLQILDSNKNVVIDNITTTNAILSIKGRLSINTEYYLHEKTAPSHYTKAEDIKFTIDEDNSIKLDGTTTVSEITMIDYETYNLTVSKTVTGSIGDRSRQYSFKITFTEGAYVTLPASISYKKVFHANEADGTAVLNENGEYSFHLSHEQSMVFEDIPYGTEYKVEEIIPENPDFQMSNRNTIGTMTEDKTAQFTNNTNAIVPTGFSLKFLPYIILLSLAAIILFLKRKIIFK